MNHVLLILIPIAFMSIHFLEFSAITARLAGIKARSHMLGYTIQQAVYVATRFFIVLLLPMLGLVVDSQIEQQLFHRMALTAVLGAAALSLLAYVWQARLVAYYTGVISRYSAGGNFSRAFWGSSALFEPVAPRMVVLSGLARSKEARTIVIQAAIVFSIYATGIFISFYAALQNFEYRASVSQLSGVINSVGTVLLTFYIEPRISRGIDADRPDAAILVQSLLIGRLLGVAILSPVLLLAAFWVL
jgi:hypothetical protein